jgi:hypothetical protein
MPRNGWLLSGPLLARIVAGPRVRDGEAHHLALEAARGTRHQGEALGGPVTKDHITGAATDTLALAPEVGHHRGPPFSTCDEGTSSYCRTPLIAHLLLQIPNYRRSGHALLCHERLDGGVCHWT